MTCLCLLCISMLCCDYQKVCSHGNSMLCCANQKVCIHSFIILDIYLFYICVGINKCILIYRIIYIQSDMTC